jgi:asparagine synthase (glutamine-hydrolysing)
VAALTLVDNPRAGEVELVTRIARAAQLDHYVIPVGDALPYEGLDDPASQPDTALPSPGVALLGVRRATFTTAAVVGSSDHLTGWSGDLVLAPRKATLVSLLRAGRRVSATRAALALARGDRSSATRVCATLLRLAASSHQQAVRRAARALRAPVVDPTVSLPSWERYLDWASLPRAAGWLTAEAKDLVARRLEALVEEPSDYHSPEQAFDWWEARRASTKNAATRALAALHGIEVHAPYRDLRILDLVFGLPGYLREPPGTFKPLVTQELADALPPALTSRRSKDGLVINDAAQRGIRRNAPVLRELIASDASILVRAGLLQRSAVGQALDATIAGAARHFPDLDRLTGIAVWLAKPRQPWWEENTCTPQPTT